MIDVKLKDILQKTFENAKITVINESHLHAGHSGSPETGQSHFKVIIESPELYNLSRLQKHQLANNAINPLFDNGLHAISFVFK